MATSTYWADKYVENRRSAQDALSLIKPGQRVFIGSSCGEPQHLVRTLSEMSVYLKDIEINRLMTLETTPLTLIANKTKDHSMNIRSFYLGSAKSKGIAQNQRFITISRVTIVVTACRATFSKHFCRIMVHLTWRLSKP